MKLKGEWNGSFEMDPASSGKAAYGFPSNHKSCAARRNNLSTDRDAGLGEIVPRDRKGTFKPSIVAKSQSRPLDDIYPVAFFDGVFFKTRSDGSSGAAANSASILYNSYM
jgi:transposase-like protein